MDPICLLAVGELGGGGGCSVIGTLMNCDLNERNKRLKVN